MDLKRLNKIWPPLGGFFALIIIIIVVILWIGDSQGSELTFLFWLNLALLMLHEFEEFFFPGGFKEFANTKTVLAMPESENFETISDKLITVINLGAWLIFIIAALLANIGPWLGFGMIIFNIVNILGHLIIFQKKHKGYNPGMVTAILMIPFLIFAIIIIAGRDLLSVGEYIIGGIIGFILGISLPLTGAIIKKKLEKSS